MTALSQAQLEEAVAAPFNAVQLDLPGYTARLWSGVGPLTMLGQTFYGAGSLAAITVIEGSLETVSPQVGLEMSGLDTAFLDEVKDYLVRGALVSVWFNLLDRATFLPLADPDLIFQGRVDQAPITLDDSGTFSVEVTCTGALEWAMRRQIGRWTPSHQESVWPGDLYCEFVDDGLLNFPWGDATGIHPRYPGLQMRGGGGSGGRPGGGPNTNYREV